MRPRKPRRVRCVPLPQNLPRHHAQARLCVHTTHAGTPAGGPPLQHAAAPKGVLSACEPWGRHRAEDGGGWDGWDGWAGSNGSDGWDGWDGLETVKLGNWKNWETGRLENWEIRKAHAREKS